MGEEADLKHPWAARYRIPLIDHLWPGWKFEVALVRPRRRELYGAVWPTEQEATIIGSFIDYRRNYYTDIWQARMLERPLDADSGTNTVILLKTADGWRYRKATWSTGSWPYIDTDPAVAARFTPDAVGLVAIIDHEQNYGGEWVSPRYAAWKQAHADIWEVAR